MKDYLMKNKISVLIFLSGFLATINTIFPAQKETTIQQKRHSDERPSSGSSTPNKNHHRNIVETVVEQGKEFFNKHKHRSSSPKPPTSNPQLTAIKDDYLQSFSLKTASPNLSPRENRLTNQELTGNAAKNPIAVLEEKEIINIVNPELTKRLSEKKITYTTPEPTQSISSLDSKNAVDLLSPEQNEDIKVPTIWEDFKQTLNPIQNQIAVSFVDTQDPFIPWYKHVNSKKIDDDHYIITYKNYLNEEKTITCPLKENINDHSYLFVIEINERIVRNYGINLKKEIRLDTYEQKNNYQTCGYLTSNFTNMPANIIHYDAIAIQDINSSTCKITYRGENKAIQSVLVEKTLTPQNPTFAIIIHNGKNVNFVIDLQKIPSEITNDNTIDLKLTPQKIARQNKINPRSALIGIVFFACCIGVAYQYNKLPDAFAKLLDSFFAQCNNLIPSSFAHTK